MKLKGKLALVTGSSRGIGRAIALKLAEEGADIIVNFLRHKQGAEETAREAEKLGVSAQIIKANLVEPEKIDAMFETIASRWGRLDILVNNAGITKDGLAMRMKEDAWNLVLQINLSGAFACIQQVLPAMVKARWGRIVNIASVVGQMGNAGQANYAASKAGLIGLSKSVAKEIGSRGITVNVVAPGFIETDMTDAALAGDAREQLLAKIPLRRIGTPNEVAEAVAWLASPAAAYVTGHVLRVNGGLAI